MIFYQTIWLKRKILKVTRKVLQETLKKISCACILNILAWKKVAENILGADFKNNQTTQKEYHQIYYCLLDEQFYFGQEDVSKVMFCPSYWSK